MSERFNGSGGSDEELQCPLQEGWQDLSSKLEHAISSLEVELPAMRVIAKNTSEAVSLLRNMNDHLLLAATGRDGIPSKTMHVLIRTLGLVIAGLVFVIVFLLTGTSFPLHH